MGVMHITLLNILKSYVLRIIFKIVEQHIVLSVTSKKSLTMYLYI